jgi:hypothetical protein
MTMDDVIGLDLSVVSFAGLGIFLALHFLIVPFFYRRVWSTKVGQATKAAIYLFLETVRSLSILVALASGLTLAGLRLIDLKGGATIAEVASSIVWIKSLQAYIQSLGTWFGMGHVALLALGLGFLSWRGGKARINKALDKARELELKRLQDERDAGKWEELPLTPEMEELVQADHENEQILAAVEAEIINNSGDEQAVKDLDETRQQIEAKKNEIAEVFFALDVQRRLDVHVEPADIEWPPPSGFLPRLTAFFFSRGLMGSLQGVSRIVFILAILLMIPALLGVATPTANASLEAKLMDLDQLQVTLGSEQAENTWQEAKKNWPEDEASPEKELSLEDQQALDLASRAYEVSLIRYNARLLNLSTTPSRVIHQYRAREAILNRLANRTKSTDSPMAVKRSGTSLSAKSPDAKALSMYQEMLDHNGPVSNEGRRFRKELENQVARRSPDQWGHFKKKIKNGMGAFQQTVSRAEMKSMLVTRAMGSGADFIDGAGLPDYLSQNRTQSRVFMASLNSQDSLDDAIKAVANSNLDNPTYTKRSIKEMKTVSQRMPKMTSVEAHLANFPPHAIRPPEPYVNIGRASTLTNQLASYNTTRGLRVTETMADSLSSFNDFFPGQVGGDTATTRHKTLKKAGLVTGTPSSAASKQSFKMARSYTRLSGFRRIGGVLIGRDPKPNGPKLDFQDISWETKADGVHLSLHQAGGKKISLGPYRPGIIHLALGYAADGRPVTVTMTTSEPLHELKIHLHPTLVDTGLGCRLINLDRFVDQTTAKNKKLGKLRSGSNQRVFDHLSLYNLAWATNYLNHWPKLLMTEPGLKDSFLASLAQRAQLFLEIPEFREEAQWALEYPEALADPKLSPLTVKKEYFNPKLVNNIRTCTKGKKNSLKTFLGCIDRKASKDGRTSEDNKIAWSAPPPKFEPWSGVRELDFQKDANLGFLSAPKEAQNAFLWPFDFIIQLAFSTPPYFVPSNEPWYSDKNIEVEQYNDQNPWSFPSISEELTMGVAQEIQSSAEYKDILLSSREFAILQRLFRVALNGGLGPKFPLGKLADLAQDTSRGVTPGARTMRWNVRPGSLEMRFGRNLISMMKDLKDKRFKSLAQAGDKCIDFLNTNESGFGVSAKAEEEWNKSCNLERFSKQFPFVDNKSNTLNGEEAVVQDIISSSVRINLSRKIRKELGVHEDEKFAKKQQSCPKI